MTIFFNIFFIVFALIFLTITINIIVKHKKSGILHALVLFQFVILPFSLIEIDRKATYEEPKMMTYRDNFLVVVDSDFFIHHITDYTGGEVCVKRDSSKKILKLFNHETTSIITNCEDLRD